MAISKEERRFLRNWEEQRQDGKSGYIVTYSIGLFIMFFMLGVILGLFSGMAIVRIDLLVYWSIGSAVAAIVSAYFLWKKQETRFKRIIRREVAADQ